MLGGWGQVMMSFCPLAGLAHCLLVLTLHAAPPLSLLPVPLASKPKASLGCWDMKIHRTLVTRHHGLVQLQAWLRAGRWGIGVHPLTDAHRVACTQSVLLLLGSDISEGGQRVPERTQRCWGGTPCDVNFSQ